MFSNGVVPLFQSDLNGDFSSIFADRDQQAPTHSCRPTVAQPHMDADGNWVRQTDGKIQGKAIEREVEALENRLQIQSHTQAVDDHHTPMPCPSPTGKSAFMAKAEQALALASKVRPITL
jgi:hypothetical protein